MPNETKIFEEPTKTAYKYLDPETGDLVVKAVAKIKIPLAITYKLLTEFEVRHLWDFQFHDFELLQTDGPGDCLMYFAIKTPFIVSNRDFVVRRNIYQNYAGYDYLMFMNSEESPLKGPRRKYVRG